jgi:LysM repeat protein
MRSLILFLLASTLFIQAGHAQKAELWAKKSDKGLYLEHKVVPKESYFSIGRKYNVTPKSLAAFNNLDINKGLQIDQKLRVPLNDSNFIQTGYTGTPVYYKVGANEGFTEVSRIHNGVSTTLLREWNGSETPEKGDRLMIGFLQSREMPAITVTPKKVKQDNNLAKADKDKDKDKDKEKEKDREADQETDKNKPAENAVAEKKEPANGPKTEEKKTEPIQVVNRIEVKPTVAGQGYFQKHFEQQIKTNPASKNETVTAGIFKTLSGWDDAKYYLLIDAVQPGTIVKIINPGNNKAVYAKVLGQMSGIRQNEGLSIRISNAAAAALEISETDKFIVTINY